MLKPNNVNAIGTTALALKNLGNLIDAEQMWLKCVSLSPTCYDHIEQLVSFWNQQQRYNDVLALLSNVLSGKRPQDDHFVSSDWCRYLSLTLTYANIQYSRLQIEQSAKLFALIVTLVISNRPIDVDPDVGILLLDSELITGISGSQYPSNINVNLHENGNRNYHGISSLIAHIQQKILSLSSTSSLLLFPQQATKYLSTFFQQTNNISPLAYRMLVSNPNLHPENFKQLAMVTSNALLNLAKIFQDGLNSSGANLNGGNGNNNIANVDSACAQSHNNICNLCFIDYRVPTHYDILLLYYLSLVLNPSPSTANNIGILISSMSVLPEKQFATGLNSNSNGNDVNNRYGLIKQLALEYYKYGLSIDPNHPHLYTNLGSLLKEQGKPLEAIAIYHQAVKCDANFYIALTNLASALKDLGKTDEAIYYFEKAVAANPGFVEAVVGLANSKGCVCDWSGRGVVDWEVWGVDENDLLHSKQDLIAQRDAKIHSNALTHIQPKVQPTTGWIENLISIIDSQIQEHNTWGQGTIESLLCSTTDVNNIFNIALNVFTKDNTYKQNLTRSLSTPRNKTLQIQLFQIWRSWAGKKNEGTKLLQLIIQCIKILKRLWFLDISNNIHHPPTYYTFPLIPSILPPPPAISVLPFHTFTLPVTNSQIREISMRCSLKASYTALTQPWLPRTIYKPPRDPSYFNNKLNIGYISSDFMNHPLAHLMQSVFGLHNSDLVTVFCYATSVSDNSEYRHKIEREAHVFRDCGNWTNQQIIEQIVKDEIHVLVNLNGFTRGARNEVFGAHPAPIQCASMGFAGSLGGGWNDYLIGDPIAVGEKQFFGNNYNGEDEWVYTEKIVYLRHSFFICDHRQSAPDSLRRIQKNREEQKSLTNIDVKTPTTANTANRIIMTEPLTWQTNMQLRQSLRQQLFPNLPPNAFLIANFNQLYKIDPIIFKSWLTILSSNSNIYFWLLQFPISGQTNLLKYATIWTNNDQSVISRILFTPVADKDAHILRCRVPDLVVDTPECGGHTTTTDTVWSSTPVLAFPRQAAKLCSRVAASIVLNCIPDDYSEFGFDANNSLQLGLDNIMTTTAATFGGGVNGNYYDYRNDYKYPQFNDEMVYDSQLEDIHTLVYKLIVSSENEYENRILEFATPRGQRELLRIRKAIFDTRENGQGTVFDTKGYAGELEDAYWKMWKDWVNGRYEDIYI